MEEVYRTKQAIETKTAKASGLTMLPIGATTVWTSWSLLKRAVICSPVDYLNGPHYTLYIYDAEMVAQDQLGFSSIF